MRRAEGYYILSLLLAGSAAFAGSAWVVAPLLIAGSCCTAVGIRRGRCLARRSASTAFRRIAQLQASAHELEARLVAALLESESARSAIDELTAQVAPIVDAASPSAVASPSAAAPAVVDNSTASEALVRRLSHELRTPLTSIQACSELLIEGEAVEGATARELAGMIHAESQRLALVIDGALTTSRLDVGQLQVTRNKLSLNDVAQQVMIGLQPLAEQRRVRLTLDQSGGGATVLADRHLIEHVLRILVCDAIHHASSGAGVTIRSDVDADRSMACLEVHCHCPQAAQKARVPEPDRPNGDDGNGVAHFVPPDAGVDLVRRLIETVHAGATISRRTDDARVTGFELPIIQATRGHANSCDEVTDV